MTSKKKSQPKNKGGRPQEYSVQFLEGELRKANGRVYIAAKAIGCTAKILYDYLTRYPHLKELVEEFRQLIVDKAEDGLESAVEAKEAWAVCFTLKTLGKERGYVERNELTGADGKDLVPDIKSMLEKVYGNGGQN